MRVPGSSLSLKHQFLLKNSIPETPFVAMANIRGALLWILLSAVQFGYLTPSKPEEPQTYIVHVDASMKPAPFLSHEACYGSMLESFSPNNSVSVDGSALLICSYKHAMLGFSARLTPSQLSEIQRSPAHRATYRESFGKLLTTHTSKFLGLNPGSGMWPAASFGEGVILGVVDTGIWPESESFHDTGMPLPPSRWKGECENGERFNTSNCNNKLIGARSFRKWLIAAGAKLSKSEYDSARGFINHGTHTSSVTAGASITGASYFGYGSGTATGIAPMSHLAIYKVAWETNNVFVDIASSDVLAAMDKASPTGLRHGRKP